MNQTMNAKELICGGLINLGNTCFLNSCIQILNHTYELNDLFSPNVAKHMKPNDSTVVLKEWDDLRIVMCKSEGQPVSPNRFVDVLKQITHKMNGLFELDGNQHDACEFLLFILDCFHNSISRSQTICCEKTDELSLKCYEMFKKMHENDFSEIIHLFHGVSLSTIVSMNGKVTHSIIPEKFVMLDLPIPSIIIYTKKQQTIYDCINLYVKEETMEGDNAWFNDATGAKENVKKQTRFWNLPVILVISFKRFGNCGRTKLNNKIEFPLKNLDLSNYVVGCVEGEKHIYDLYAVCNHIGNAHNGHYTSVVQDGEKWVHYNDHMIEIVENPAEIVNEHAYCLFYRKNHVHVA